jgi:hypothetical protein
MAKFNINAQVRQTPTFTYEGRLDRQLIGAYERAEHWSPCKMTRSHLAHYPEILLQRIISRGNSVNDKF